MSARDKELTLKDWRRFLESGMVEAKFTKRLYRHLTLHCSFIAHYDKYGFYAVYFTDNADNTTRFLNQFLSGRSAEMPGDWWQDRENSLGMRDINEAMMQVAKEYAPGLLAKSWEAERVRDLAEAERLLKKHGVG